MSRRLAAFALSTVLVVSFLAVASVAPVTAVTSAPLPTSMAAVGDSITQAASSAGSLGADAPQNSWSTGTSTTVNSHFLRLQQLSPGIVAYNRSVSGAKVADLAGQMDTVVTLSPDPGYLTVLIGGNDLCTDTVGQMTSVADFRAQFSAAMSTITSGSPGTYVYVVSIPDVWQLWNLFKNNFWARFVWSTANICQSLLASPTSTQAADVERRNTVRQRNIDYNLALEEVCESAAFSARCHFDQNAAFSVQFTTSDVSGDYFHPSVAGQAKLASVSWTAGYTWQTGTATPTPTPTPTPAASIFVSDLDGIGTSVNRNFWRANVTATVLDSDGGPVASATVTGQFGTSSKSCVTGSSGTCTLTSDNLRSNVASIGFTLSGVSHATLSYDPALDAETSIVVARP